MTAQERTMLFKSKSKSEVKHMVRAHQSQASHITFGASNQNFIPSLPTA